MTKVMQVTFARPAASALAASVLLVLCLALPARASASTTLANWDQIEQRQVVSAHLMANVGRSFQGASSLTSAQANAAMSALGTRLSGSGAPTSARAARTSQNPVTLVTFDQMLVMQLGLSDVAAHVQSVASAAGLKPPAYFGSEVVARYLGLRYNHPAGTDALELYP